MSFLKIKDPSKRDALFAEYLKTKKKIQNHFRSERLGEESLYEDFGNIFKPITEQQKKSSEEIVSRFAPLQEAIENMPPALPWGQDEGQPEAKKLFCLFFLHIHHMLNTPKEQVLAFF